MPEQYYALAASVPPGNRVKSFFADGADAPSWTLTDAERFRHAGFDVYTGDVARLVEGDYWEARNGNRKLVRLYQDGTMIFRVRADKNFLAWGSARFGGPKYVFLNPVAVVESHASFVRLYARIVPRLLESPKTVLFSFRFLNAELNGRRLAITHYYPRGIQNVVEPSAYPIHSSAAEGHLAISTDRIIADTDGAAHDVIAEFYKLFDADPAMIPFVKGDDAKAIDVDAIIGL